MEVILQEEVVGKVIANVFCDFDAAGIIELVSGRSFALPSVLMTEVCSAPLPTNCAPWSDWRLKGALIKDLLRPRDLSDIYTEIQSSVSVLLDNGIIFSLEWNGNGPYMHVSDPIQSPARIDGLQSFWMPFDLPSVAELPELKKWTCRDIANAQTECP